MASCGGPQWEAGEPILLENVSPIGIDVTDDGIWLSDGDRSTLLEINEAGVVLSKMEELERPMHIEVKDGSIYVPSYGLDAILKIKGSSVDTLEVGYPMDAPAGVSVDGNRIAIADFYNHRILYFDGTTWSKYGGDKKGKEDGQYDYPTDVQIVGDKIYIADAYNNRGQVISTSGEHLLTFGVDQDMNAATGIYVTEDEIWMTDFEHDRILIFDLDGKVKQILAEGFFKPTDVVVKGNVAYVANYKGGYISRIYK